MTQKSASEKIRLNPFTVALLLARSMLPPTSAVLRTIEGIIRARDLPRLAEAGQFLDAPYSNGEEVWSTIVLRQIASIFKKNDAFVDERRCSEQARKNFELGERICRITNRRLDHYHAHPERMPGKVRGWVDTMEGDIASLIGDVRKCGFAFSDHMRLTGGATQDRSRARSMPFLKVSGLLKAPRAALPYIGRVLLDWGINLSDLKFTSTSRNEIGLVPKNWKTHRTIAKEPTHALPFQLALDSFLKRKLRKWGIDLSTQEKNQELARQGSIDGSLATIDLRMASDLICYNLVAWFLPSDWFAVFDAFRSSSYSGSLGDGSYAKFSSMGNGYTFTLETLIFTAACRAVGSQRYSVYGDDIIIESHLAPDLVQLLRFLGFAINREKSFVNPESRFRESCGCDYYEGQLVTPFYLRECPKESDKSGWSHVVNGLIACTPPGPLWDWLTEKCVTLKLRLVPFNTDTRSGVFITPNRAWATKKITVDTRAFLPRSRKGDVEQGEPRQEAIPNPDYGHPVFKGYGVTSERRKTFGWRSYLLWHMEKCYEGDRSRYAPSGRSSYNLLSYDPRRTDDDTFGSRPETSCVAYGSRYVHRVRRFYPKTPAPSYLFTFEDECGNRLGIG
jgi:hypothetical protein